MCTAEGERHHSYLFELRFLWNGTGGDLTSSLKHYRLVGEKIVLSKREVKSRYAFSRYTFERYWCLMSGSAPESMESRLEVRATTGNHIRCFFNIRKLTG